MGDDNPTWNKPPIVLSLVSTNAQRDAIELAIDEIITSSMTWICRWSESLLLAALQSADRTSTTPLLLPSQQSQQLPTLSQESFTYCTSAPGQVTLHVKLHKECHPAFSQCMHMHLQAQGPPYMAGSR